MTVDTIRSTPTRVGLVRLVAFDEQTYRLYVDLVS